MTDTLLMSKELDGLLSSDMLVDESECLTFRLKLDVTLKAVLTGRVLSFSDASKSLVLIGDGITARQYVEFANAHKAWLRDSNPANRNMLTLTVSADDECKSIYQGVQLLGREHTFLPSLGKHVIKLTLAV